LAAWAGKEVPYARRPQALMPHPRQGAPGARYGTRERQCRHLLLPGRAVARWMAISPLRAMYRSVESCWKAISRGPVTHKCPTLAPRAVPWRTSKVDQPG